MIAAHEEGRTSVAERLQVVTRQFAEAGIDLDRPYLRSGSTGDYPFNPDPGPPPQPHTNGARKLHHAEQEEPPLTTAAAIGRRLCDTAIWHQDRCTWIGPSGRDPSGLTFGALGPDLYGGTSGVAWFLADLAAITGNDAARRTALGAIRHAFTRADVIVPTARIGLYSGWLGLALAAAHVGVALEEPGLLGEARHLVSANDVDGAGPAFVDLMAGSAGGIIGLLALNDLLDDPSLVETAVRLGDDLLRRAVRSDAGASWRTINAVDEYHLTGLAHGAAGIALAFVELFQATNDARYRAAADLAFSYERHWFDATQGNWPDLREAAARNAATAPRHALAFSTYWCHGAPGIGLSRLRAYHILRDPRLRIDAAIALGTTRHMIEESLPTESVNFSLCHGLAGNAEALLLGAELLPEVCSGAAELAAEVGATGARRHRGTDADWPSGAPGGISPSLMLGLAGIGHFYLRLHDPSLRSVLLLRGRTTAAAHP
jgi:lantibiotic modifying enzyme